MLSTTKLVFSGHSKIFNAKICDLGYITDN